MLTVQAYVQLCAICQSKNLKPPYDTRIIHIKQNGKQGAGKNKEIGNIKYDPRKPLPWNCKTDIIDDMFSFDPIIKITETAAQDHP